MSDIVVFWHELVSTAEKTHPTKVTTDCGNYYRQKILSKTLLYIITKTVLAGKYHEE